MSSTRQFTIAAAFFCCLAAVSVSAQETSLASQGPAPANLAYVEGGVDLVHDGLTERADPPMMLLEGDIVRTRNGRAEIIFGDGTLLHLDIGAEIEILGSERIRLLNGRAELRLSSAAPRPYTIDTPAAVVRFDTVGEYRILTDQARGSLEVMVVRGSAEIDDGSQRARVHGGQSVMFAGTGLRPVFQTFNSARFDSFTQWASRRAYGMSGSASSAQLPYELRPYAPLLDQHGRWDYEAPYGYVWFPSVGVAWRPYYEGAWGHTRYGWTWHGRDRWAWPTHHYGRWGFNGNFWFWIPANVWGPAWVSWGFAPGYVSWSPLGWDGLPVIGFASHYGYNPWRSWTVVPRDHFGFRRPVRAHAIDGARLDRLVRTSLIVQNTPPTEPASAVPRGSVVGPGATGNVRRFDPELSRRGNVRRPQSPATAQSAPASDAVTSPAAGVPVNRRIPDDPRIPDGRRIPDDRRIRDNRRAPGTPAAQDAPAASGGSDAGDAPAGAVRRVAPRAPSAPSTANPPAQERPGTVRGVSPRSEPRGEAPRSEGTRDNGGAQRRGGSAGAPAQAAPPPSAPPPSGGAVRRRPGAGN
jgi:hypothetical protein